MILLSPPFYYVLFLLVALCCFAILQINSRAHRQAQTYSKSLNGIEKAHLFSPTLQTKRKEMSLEVDITALVAAYGVTGLQEKIASTVPEDRGARFTGDTYNIALYIQRSKNENVVCYAGAYEDAAAGVIHPANPIDAFWMDIDPEYVKSNRESGKMDDRVELNLIDRTMAYGHSASEPRDASGLVYFEVKFVALSSRRMLFLSAPHRGGNGSGDGAPPRHTPVLLCVIGGVPSVAQRIYVKSTEPKHFWNLPSVEYVELFGHSIETGEATYEKITNA